MVLIRLARGYAVTSHEAEYADAQPEATDRVVSSRATNSAADGTPGNLGKTKTPESVLLEACVFVFAEPSSDCAVGAFQNRQV